MDYVTLGKTGLKVSRLSLGVALGVEDVAELEAPYRPKPVAGHG